MFYDIKETFLDYFEGLKDPRSKRNQLHGMSEILLVALSAAICGAEGWQDVEDFGKIKLDQLRHYLPYKNGIPSDDTFRRFFRSLDPLHFQELFRAWMKSLHPCLDKAVIAIDGKCSRHSFDSDSNMLHMVSAYATEARIVLGQEKVSEKSNEITAIPKLLEWLDLKGATVTIDAMGCQYKIADQILAKEGHYILSLKGNQGGLSEDVEAYFDKKTLSSLKMFKDLDKGHGRLETRKCWISTEIDWLKERHPRWSSINSIICIESLREIKGKASAPEMRHYVSSLNTTPEKALHCIRSHWAIENSLHWVLDMSFGDDQSRIRKENAPQNMAIIRHMALNLLQLTKAQMKRQSIKRLRKMAGWDEAILNLIISQKIS